MQSTVTGQVLVFSMTSVEADGSCSSSWVNQRNEVLNPVSLGNKDFM